jgi:hypothetical protein
VLGGVASGVRAPAERRLEALVFRANGYLIFKAWVRRFNGNPNIPWDLWEAAVKKARSSCPQPHETCQTWR